MFQNLNLMLVLAHGVPSVTDFKGDMSKEMKENLLFAIVTGESENKSANDMAKHIALKMRTIYGGYWSAFAQSYGYEKFDFKKRTYAYFDYASRHWRVYQNDCGSSGSMVADYAQFPYTLTFDSSTNMNGNFKEDLIQTINLSEFSSWDWLKNVNTIYDRMKRIYGGGWSVHSNYHFYSDHSYSHFHSISGYYAKFSGKLLLNWKYNEYFVIINVNININIIIINFIIIPVAPCFRGRRPAMHGGAKRTRRRPLHPSQCGAFWGDSQKRPPHPRGSVNRPRSA